MKPCPFANRSPRSGRANALTPFRLFRTHANYLKSLTPIYYLLMNATLTALFLSRRFVRGSLLACFLAGLTSPANAQGFNAGSTGALGDLVVETNTVVKLPPDGILNYRTLTVNAGVALSFKRNERSTPVTILSQGDVVINGTINISGEPATDNNGGFGGPGGFDGGKPGFAHQLAGGNGYGPGGGRNGTDTCDTGTDPASAGPGGGVYANRAFFMSGNVYGSPLLINLVGGSGGGGGNEFNRGGGGGGGAILIAANTKIALNGGGSINGQGGAGSVACALNGGSGGAVRLVATRVEGSGTIDVNNSARPNENYGRIRVDAIDFTGMSISFVPSIARTAGSNLLAIPPVVPHLNTIAFDDTLIPLGSTNVTFFLKFDSKTNRTIKVQARDFNRDVPIEVVLTPNSGPVLRFQTNIINTTINPAVVEVPVNVPVNTLVTVHAWTR